MFMALSAIHQLKIPKKNNTLNYITIYFWFITSLLFQQYPTEPQLSNEIILRQSYFYLFTFCISSALSLIHHMKIPEKNNTLIYFTIYFWFLTYILFQQYPMEPQLSNVIIMRWSNFYLFTFSTPKCHLFLALSSIHQLKIAKKIIL